MIRINITITPKIQAKLKKASKSTGVSVSELIRRLVDEYLDRMKK